MTVNSSTDPNNVGPLSKIVLDYGHIMKRIIDHDSKQPGFTVEGWAELAAMVDTDRFERVGNFLEVVSWDEYAEMLTNWSIASPMPTWQQPSVRSSALAIVRVSPNYWRTPRWTTKRSRRRS